MFDVHIHRSGTIAAKEREELPSIRRSFALALDRFAHAIRDIHVFVADVNGPKGGIDKVCRAQLRLYPGGILVVKSTGASVLDAAGSACSKVREVLARRLSKRRSRERAAG